jgi:hypothetical protein
MNVSKSTVMQELTEQSVIIFTHDFFDSPGIYGAGMFNDHVEWVEEVIKTCRKYNKPFILKAHPNGRECSNIVLKNIAKKYHCGVSTDEIGWEQIRNTRSIIFTVYGTVASEGYFSHVPVYTFGSGNYSRLPNVVNVLSYTQLDSVIRNMKFLKVPKYQACIVDDPDSCIQKLSGVTIDFGFDLVLDDCSKDLWKEIGFSQAWIKNSGDRYKFLRHLAPSDEQAFRNFCRNSADFAAFKKALSRSIGL